MKADLANPLKPKEWAVLAGTLLAAGLIYGLLIYPSLQLCSNLEQAKESKQQATAELDQVRSRLEQLDRRIGEARKRLAEVGGPPPHENEKDNQIARLTVLAGRCGVTVDQYAPIDVLDNDGYRAFFVQFIGRGGFDAVHRYFATVESEMDFVDLTHFAMTANLSGETAVCSIVWSCQINGVRTDPDETAASPGPLASREFASHAR